jgi:dTDP-glucose 4,6-dehydratase
MKERILLTGCAGFIGSNFVKKITLQEDVKNKYNFVIADALTYAGHYPTIENEVKANKNLEFAQVDIRDEEKLAALFEKYSFSGVIHFAAESHVDNSIENPNVFLETNVMGTLNLLRYSLREFQETGKFRFLQVGTDEVYGSLNSDEPAFTESHKIAPNSPYSSSKASADLLVRSFFHTYGLPTLISRCSNNYGPYQFPEKLIPLMIHNALADKPLPMYGDGSNVRDWIQVEDHNKGIWDIFTKGQAGEVYNLGGGQERNNKQVIETILDILHKPHSLIESVTDRLGHDFRYAINYSKAQNELGWSPTFNFEEGLALTVRWYVENQDWVKSVKKV